MHRTALAVAAVALAGLAQAGGSGPANQANTINYQGVLKDADTGANGNYEFRFRLFNWPNASTGIMLAEQTLIAPVNDGFFNAELSFGDDIGRSDVWIGVEVQPVGGSGFTQLEGRQPVNSAPRAAFAHRVPNNFQVGDSGNAGTLTLFDFDGTPGFRSEPDGFGQGHFAQFIGPNGRETFDGRFDAMGPRWSVFGVDGEVVIEPGNTTANDKVRLPANSVTSAELGDEAGVAAQSINPGSTSLSTTYSAVASQTIDCPSDGYIIAMANLDTTTFDFATTFMAISLDGATAYNGRDSRSRSLSNAFANTSVLPAGVVDVSVNVSLFSQNDTTQSLTQVIPVSAGATTVSMIARCSASGDGEYSSGDLTLLFVPTSYGAVVARDGLDAQLASSHAGVVPIAGQPDPLPYQQMFAKQRALEAQMTELRAEMEATMREQAEANGR